ncbi:type II toxin-antitoxin system RelE/ParE family toxin [uncultured Thiodictyon sp.]|uniref:type II toxin-antitoxin system RelE/ParE family toxin n=1 Tax=uncultured Thiodictyon sp. TaxID=1846217 RepID=UPI0025D50EA8|nr:type II toxin-antitoxin system RelE/ParE family toxin [uncultured Thiodictyon sp.]
MKFFLHEAAESELDHAAAYYESCRVGLGIEFAEEVYRAVSLAAAFPDAGSPCSENTRRLLVRRFPFGVIYRVKGQMVEVLAVADLRRHPGYWRDRMI